MTEAIHHTPWTKTSRKEIPDWYEVKYREVAKKGGRMMQGPWLYGIFNKYDDETEREWAKGNAIIEDALTGQLYRVPLAKFAISPIERDYESGNPWETEYSKFVEAEFEKAQAASKELKGLQVGKLFNTGVADGYAYYVVTKVNKRTVQVEWRGFGGDRYADQVLGYGGSFPRAVIERLVESQEALAEIFGG